MISTHGSIVPLAMFYSNISMTTKQEIAAINLSKFRKAQVDLTETQERADLTEQAYAKYKARGRSASIARDM